MPRYRATRRMNPEVKSWHNWIPDRAKGSIPENIYNPPTFYQNWIWSKNRLFTFQTHSFSKSHTRIIRSQNYENNAQTFALKWLSRKKNGCCAAKKKKTNRIGILSLAKSASPFDRILRQLAISRIKSFTFILFMLAKENAVMTFSPHYLSLQVTVIILNFF